MFGSQKAGSLVASGPIIVITVGIILRLSLVGVFGVSFIISDFSSKFTLVTMETKFFRDFSSKLTLVTILNNGK